MAKALYRNIGTNQMVWVPVGFFDSSPLWELVEGSGGGGVSQAELDAVEQDPTGPHGIADFAELITDDEVTTRIITHKNDTDPHGDRAYTDTATDLLIPLAQKGAANGVAELGSDSKIPAGQVPAISLTDYLGPVASQAAMLALVPGQLGDWTIRTDLSTTWVISGVDPTQLSSWTELGYPNAVTSVAGKTGIVTLAGGDITSGTVVRARLPVGTGGSDVAAGDDSRITGAVQDGDVVFDVKRYAVGNANFLHVDGQWYTDSSHTTLATDDTAAIRALVTAGARRLDFGAKRYRIQWTQQTAFLTWTGVNGVEIIGNGAVLCDTSTYTANPANPYTPVFLFDACKNVTVNGVGYEGPTITSPATEHGYKGATFVRAMNACQGVEVTATLKNLRYGVQSGSYPTAADGYSKGFRIDVKTDFCGYPVALNLADDVHARIDAVDVHRACYLAGVVNADIDVRFKNQWIAGMVLLLTDSLTGVGTSRGCRNIRGRVTDMGSDRTELTCVMAGIALQRVDPGTTFADIDLKVYGTSTDSIGQNLSAFQIVSGAGGNPTYPLHWVPTIHLKNITLGGMLDKSAQTTSQSTGLIYVQTNDGVSYATVSNLRIDGLTLKPSSGAATLDYLYVQGLVDQATISNCVMDNYSFQIIGNTTYPVVIENSQLGNVTSQTRTIYTGSRLRSLTDASWSNAVTVNTEVFGAAARIRTRMVELTLTGASVTWTSAILAGVVILGVTGRITQAITGSTGLQIGVSGDLGRYLNTNTTTAGFTFGPLNAAGTETNPRWSGGASISILATSKTSDFTAGKVRLMLSYIDFTAPAS